MRNIFQKFKNANSFIQGGIVTLLLFFTSLLATGLMQLRSPEPSSTEFSQVKATLVHINPGNQRGGTFSAKDHLENDLKNFITLSSVTSVDRNFRSYIGKVLVIKHYERVVVSCLADNVPICTPRCATPYECKRKIFDGDLIVIKWLAYTFLVLSILCFLSFFINKRKP